MEKQESSIQVIDRALWLLKAMADHGEGVNLKFLAADTGLHPSTAFRILAALQVHGLVARDSAGSYRVGPMLRQLAGQAVPAPDVREAAREAMARVRDQVNETVNLTIREGDEVVYVERTVANRMMRVEQVIGSRAPLHVTAVGKLMLAEMGPRACDDYAQRTGLPRFTANTLTSVAALKKAVAQAQQRGYAYDNEEAELGVGCIGTVVRDGRGAVVAGLSISAPIERRRDSWIALLQEAAGQIATRLA